MILNDRKEVFIMTNQPRQLTNQESAFAAEHHHVLYSFLRDNGLSEEEYYDVAVFGFLDAVRQHLCAENGDFEQIAYAQMLSACNAYDETQSVFTAELRSIEDTIADVKDTAEEAIHSVMWEQTLASYDATEKRVVELLVMHYPKPDIAAMLGMDMIALNKRITGIQYKSAALMIAA